MPLASREMSTGRMFAGIRLVACGGPSTGSEIEGEVQKCTDCFLWGESTPLITGSGEVHEEVGSMFAKSIENRFLLSLHRAEKDRLENLRRLENRMCTVAPADRPAVQGKIDAVMEEVASLNRTIQEHRATHPMAAHQ